MARSALVLVIIAVLTSGFGASCGPSKGVDSTRDTDTDSDTDTDTDTDADTDTDTDTDTDSDTDTDTDTDTDGNLLWVKRAGGTGYDLATGIVALSDGSAYMAGRFRGAAVFGPGETGETELVSGGSEDLFVARHNADGSLDWVKRAGGGAVTDAVAEAELTLLGDGSLVATGGIIGGATFGPGETNETSLSSLGSMDMYVAEFESDGSLSWARSAGGTDDVIGCGVSAFADGSSVVSGYYYDTVTLGQGEVNQTDLVSAGGSDVFFSKYGPDGTLSWAMSAGGASDDFAWDVFAFSDGTFIVTGYFHGSATLGQGESEETTLVSDGGFDVFIARFASDGALSWVTRAGGVDHEASKSGYGFADGSFLLAGYFEGTATFGSGESSETILTSAGDYDVFFAGYNSDGSLIWAKRAGGTGRDSADQISAFSDGTFVVAGLFHEDATFGPGEADETVLSSSGAADVFVAKFDSDGALMWVKGVGGPDWEMSTGVSTLDDGSSLISGYYGQDAIFGAGELNETILSSTGGSDIFIAKFGP